MLVDFPRLDFFSLIFGFLVTIFLVWIINFFYRDIKNWKLSKSVEKKNENISRNTLVAWEKKYLEEIYLKVQSNHLSSPIFSLDEIIVPPRFLVPHLKPHELGEKSRDDIFATIPYIPGWPELATKYKTPSITVSDLLNSNADFIILGFPGMGKSVALAYITSHIARMNVGNASPGGLVPIYFHISEIQKNFSPTDIIKLITDILTTGNTNQSRTF